MKYAAFSVSSFVLLLSQQPSSASNVATQTVTFSINPISEIGVSGDPSPFIATTAVAGSDPADVVDTSTFYAVTTNGSSERVLVSINASMPTGTMLCIMAQAPTGAVSVGSVDLSTNNQNLVTGITQVAQSNLQVSYTFETTAAAGVLPDTTRIVTFTLSA